MLTATHQAIHTCAVKFPDVASNVVHLLMDFLGDSNTASALDVIFFVREIMETHVKLRQGILERLRDTLYQVRLQPCVGVAGKTCRQGRGGGCATGELVRPAAD